MARVAQMRRAAILAGQVLQSVLKLLKAGVREMEIAAEIEYQMRCQGASGPAFESIVAFGRRSASSANAFKTVRTNQPFQALSSCPCERPVRP